MSYALAAPLQAAVYQRLISDPQVSSLVASAIYDTVPSGNLPPVYVSLGTEEVRDWSSQSGAGARHDLNISVVTDTAGFQVAKDVAGAISDALALPDLTMSRGRIVALNFLKASARRTGDAQDRRIDMKFRVHVEDNT